MFAHLSRKSAFSLSLCLSLCLGGGVLAQEAPAPKAAAPDRVPLHWGQFLSNDALGDGHDRWRTGSYAFSILRGERGQALPAKPGALLEFRLHGEAIAPADLTVVDPTDRRYAGILALGVHTQFQKAGFESSLGVEVVTFGPQTGVGALQAQAHDWLGLPEIVVQDDQIADGARLAVEAELARPMALSPAVQLRPFVEARAGDETYLRLGGDLTLGRALGQTIMARDGVTGQRYALLADDAASGPALVLGGDLARVFDSVYLPPGGVEAEPLRRRLRGGLHWHAARSDLFMGLTWLGPEFKGQPEGQLLGSLALRLTY